MFVQLLLFLLMCSHLLPCSVFYYNKNNNTNDNSNNNSNNMDKLTWLSRVGRWERRVGVGLVSCIVVIAARHTSVLIYLHSLNTHCLCGRQSSNRPEYHGTIAGNSILLINGFLLSSYSRKVSQEKITHLPKFNEKTRQVSRLYDTPKLD